MMRSYYYALFFMCVQILFANPSEQAAGTWVKQYRKLALGDVTHAYENGFAWDSKNDVGLVFGGHLGTYWGQSESDFINIKNTNMSYLFSFTDREFKKVQPSLRPPKRCGSKIFYDDSWNHFIAIGGGAEQFDYAYYEPSPTLSTLVKEGSESALVPRTLAPWAFNAETGQWYAMRPLHHSAPPAFSPHGGWGSNYCFSTEYGLALLAPTNTGRVHAYSAYSNQWVLLPANIDNPVYPKQETDICVAYDLKNRRMVWLNANTTDTAYGIRTWAYDIGTKGWRQISQSVTPTRSLSEWYFGYGAMAYDRQNATIVYLTASGNETWHLHSDSSSWIKANVATNPPSCGNMAEGLTYDSKRNAVLLYANKQDEVWSYKTGAGIAGRPNPPTGLTGVTSSNGITISWSVPTIGTMPVRYRVYRAAWDDNKSNGTAIVPYSYVLIDSTTGLTFTDNSDTLKTAETFHSYFIESVSSDGYASDPSTPVYTRLRIPFGLTTTAYSANRVVLRWKPKKESDCIGYNVYRYQRAYPYTRQMLSNRINASLLTESSYDDTTVRICGSSICTDSLAMYCVTAVNKLGKESGLSPFATTAPDWPVNFWADTVNKIISWSPPRNGNIVNYRIYSAVMVDRNSNSSPMTVTAITADTFWSYSSKPSALCYKVRAYSRMGQLGHFSDVLSIQTKDSLQFGNYKMDFQAEKPVNDHFFDDVPPISIENSVAFTKEPLGFSASPNPFNPSVKFSFQPMGEITENGYVIIYESNGRQIKKILLSKTGRRLEALWNAINYPSGIYVASITILNTTSRIKVVLSK